MKIYQLSGAFPGAIPLQLVGIELESIGAETAEQPISAPKMVSTKEGILYFGLFKTDKTGIYALGQLDSDKPNALVLSKRFDTTNYANHKPTALYIQGPNYYAAFDDNGSADNARCETNNSPARSSNAVYDTIFIDDGDSQVDKTLLQIYISAKPLAASTVIAVSVEDDYDGTFTTVTRPDGTSMNTTNDVLGFFDATGFADIKVFRIRLAFTSSGTSTAFVTGIGITLTKDEQPAAK